MLIDTHTHLDAHQFDEDREEVIERARTAGVHKLINIGFNRETIPTTMALAEQYDFIYAVVGWHPVDSINMLPGDLDWIASLCDHPKVVAIGEIGLDYHWDTSPKGVQQRVFREQIQLARQKKKPDRYSQQGCTRGCCPLINRGRCERCRRRHALLLWQLGDS